MKPEYKLVAKAKYIRLVSELADPLWRECYGRWYNSKQLTALLDALQSPEQVEAEIDDNANYFIVLLADEPVGYFSWKMEGTSLHLTHIYLQPKARHAAIGADIVAYCERLARADGKGRMFCFIPQKLLPVQAVFKKLHYRTVQPIERTVAGIDLKLVEMEHIL